MRSSSASSALSRRSNCSTSRSRRCAGRSARWRISAGSVGGQRDRDSNTKIADLGRRLNVALAQRVQELNRYRSDFFGRLREILSDRENIRIVGDRFVFQSEVLFPSGSDSDQPGWVRARCRSSPTAILELQKEIPPEINWVLRVDGHTDNVPVSGARRWKDNWELSSARATSVVKFLIAERRAGEPPGRGGLSASSSRSTRRTRRTRATATAASS
jgi:chemotaxis protein MotB